jgi:hypothetical protein
MYRFSEQLRKRTISYFAKKHDHHIDDGTADQYLASFAGLFMAFVKEPDKEVKK